jgi:hypothetical protein
MFVGLKGGALAPKAALPSDKRAMTARTVSPAKKLVDFPVRMPQPLFLKHVIVT